MSRTYDLELSCGCLIGTYDNIMMPCLSDNCKADEEYFKKKTQSEPNNNNSQQPQQTDIPVGNSSCEVESTGLHERVEQGVIKSGGVEDHLPSGSPVDTNSHPTKQTVQTESGDELSKDVKRSGASTEAKTDDVYSQLPEENRVRGKEARRHTSERLSSVGTRYVEPSVDTKQSKPKEVQHE